MDITVACDGSGNMAQLMNWLDNHGDAQASDACGFTWSNDFNMLGGGLCANSANIVTFTATDACGNSSTTTATFTIQDNDAPTVSGSLMTLNVEGCTVADAPAPYTTVAELENAGVTITDVCSDDANIIVNVSSSTSGTCPIVITRTYTVTDACSNESASFTQTINIDDTTAPTITTDVINSTVECDGSGNITQLTAWLNSNGGAIASDACSNLSWSNNFTALSDACGETGSATVTFTVTDACGNASSTTATFTIEDTAPPTIGTDAMNLTVECDGSGNTTELTAWLTANGYASASDVCSNVIWTNDFTAFIPDANCPNTGSVVVTFTATDDCGNASSTTATFTIEDTTPPVPVCNNITVQLDANGEATIDVAEVDNNSSDLCCGLASLALDRSIVYCNEVPSTTVTLTATDYSGNSASCDALITVEDNIAPTARCKNATVEITADGFGILDPSQINDGSFDNCGVAAFGLSETDFGCADLGGTAVELMVTDVNGNTSICTAMVTVTIQQGLPDPWIGAAIGNNGGAPPYFQFDPCNSIPGGEFNIFSNANNAIGVTNDNVAFAYQTLCGNGMITAKIESVDPNGYGGLMIRETADAGAKQVSVFSNLSNILRHEVRYNANTPKTVNSFFKPLPYWLRMERQGDWVFSYYSTDGMNFQYVHGVFISMQNCVEIGLASFTYLPYAQTEAVFSNVTINSSVGGFTGNDDPSIINSYQDKDAELSRYQNVASPIELQLFPNPNSGKFTVQLDKSLNTSAIIKIFNHYGQQIEQSILAPFTNHIELDIEGIPAGNYYLQLIAGKDSSTTSFVVAR